MTAVILLACLTSLGFLLWAAYDVGYDRGWDAHNPPAPPEHIHTWWRYGTNGGRANSEIVYGSWHCNCGARPTRDERDQLDQARDNGGDAGAPSATSGDVGQ